VRRWGAQNGYTVAAMLERITIDTFAPLVGQAFHLHVEGREPLGMTLETVSEIPVAGWRAEEVAAHRQPFSLLFLGPPNVVLPQAIYRFEHDGIGTFEMFIVPIGRTAEGVSYEAVFS